MSKLFKLSILSAAVILSVATISDSYAGGAATDLAGTGGGGGGGTGGGPGGGKGDPRACGPDTKRVCRCYINNIPGAIAGVANTLLVTLPYAGTNWKFPHPVTIANCSSLEPLAHGTLIP